MITLAREALEAGVRDKSLPPIDYASLPEKFCENGASFVTLTNRGELRGCIGSIEAHQPLAEDIREHAVAAAREDYRFAPVAENELESIDIEVSYLTPLTPLEYEQPEELSSRLTPHVDGVVLRDGWRRATFLPQVWEKIDDGSTRSCRCGRTAYWKCTSNKSARYFSSIVIVSI
jgi:AmmeMemoRadiSam system protein A